MLTHFHTHGNQCMRSKTIEWLGVEGGPWIKDAIYHNLVWGYGWASKIGQECIENWKYVHLCFKLLVHLHAIGIRKDSQWWEPDSFLRTLNWKQILDLEIAAKLLPHVNSPFTILIYDLVMLGISFIYSTQDAPKTLAMKAYLSAASSITFCVGRPAPWPALRSILPMMGLVCGLFSKLVHRTYCMVANNFNECSGTTRSSWSAVSSIVDGYWDSWSGDCSHGLLTLCSGEYLISHWNSSSLSEQP